MAFTYDVTTDEGLIRRYIDDTDSNDYEFEDDELTEILDQNSDDIWNAAADCCRILAAKYSKEIDELTLGKGDIRIKKRKAEHYMNLANKYDKRSGSDVVEYVDAINYNMDVNGIDNTEHVGDD